MIIVERENTNNGLFRMEKIGFSVTNLCAKYDYLGFCLYRNTVSDVLYIQYNGREKVVNRNARSGNRATTDL